MKVISIASTEEDDLYSLPKTCRVLLFDSTSDDDDFSEMSVDALINNPLIKSASSVLIEGGEPLFYPELTVFVNVLIGMEKRVYLKTLGILPLKGIPKEAVKIVILPLPKTSHDEGFLADNVLFMGQDDYLAVFILEEEDVDICLSELHRISEFKDNVNIRFYINSKDMSFKETSEVIKTSLSRTCFKLFFESLS